MASLWNSFDQDVEGSLQLLHTPFQPFSPSLSSDAEFPSLMTSYVISQEHVLRNSSSANIMLLNQKSEAAAARRGTSTDSETEEPGLAAVAMGAAAAVPQARLSLVAPRPSPTPSMKKGKAEQLLKEHGSPPGMRVTAGGRVVPTDLPLLGSPRYPRDAAGPTAVGPTNVGPHYRAYGQPPQLGSLESNGRQQQQHGAYAFPGPADQLGLSDDTHTSPALQFPSPPVGYSSNPAYTTQAGLGLWNLYASLQPPPATTPAALAVQNAYSDATAPLAAQIEKADTVSKIESMERQYSRMERELKELERNEVLKQDSMSATERQATVQRKKEMIVSLDKVRKGIKDLKTHLSEVQAKQTRTADAISTAAVPTSIPNSVLPYTYQNVTVAIPQPLSQATLNMQRAAPNDTKPFRSHPMTGAHPMPGAQFVPATNEGHYKGRRGALPGSAYDFQPAAAAAAASSEAPLVNGQRITSAEYGNQGNLGLTRPNHARLSHAVEIKVPKEDSRTVQNKQKSPLNPTSPTYEPQSAVTTARHGINGLQLSPSPPATDNTASTSAQGLENWLKEDTYDPINFHSKEIKIGHKPSLSSIDTTDFFPNNIAEHSSTKFDADGPVLAMAEKASSTQPKTSDLDPAQNGREGARDLTQLEPSKMAMRRANARSPEPRMPARSYVPQNAEIDFTSDSSAEENGNTDQLAKSFGELLKIDRRLVAALGTCRSRPLVETQIDDFIRSDPTDHFIQGFQAGITRQLIPFIADNEFDNGYCIGLIHSKRARIGASKLKVDLDRTCLVSRDFAAPLPPQGHRKSLSSEWQSSRKNSNVSNSGVIHVRHLGLLDSSLTSTHESVAASDRASTRALFSPDRPTPRSPDFGPAAGHFLGPAVVQRKHNENNPPACQRSQPALPAKDTASFRQGQTGKGEYSLAATTTKQANGWVSQFDGASEDLQNLIKSAARYPVPSRRTSRRKNRQSLTRASVDGACDSAVEQSKEHKVQPALPCVSRRKPSWSPTKSKLESLANAVIKTVKPSDEQQQQQQQQSQAQQLFMDGEDDRKPTERERTRKREMWRENWRKRFQEIKAKEREEIEKYQRQNPL